MSAWVEVNKEWKSKGRVWTRGDLIHVPSCVARAMDRHGHRKLKESDPKVKARKKKLAARRAAEAKRQTGARAKAKAAKEGTTS